MSKKILFFLMLLLVSLIFLGCSKKESNVVPIPPPPTPEEQNHIANDDGLMIGQVKEKIPMLSDAYEGKMQGINISIGMDEDALQDNWGFPEARSKYEGLLAIQYSEATFLIDENKNEIVGIAVFKQGKEYYGVTLGMKPKEIQNIYGPAAELIEVEEEWKMVYNLEDYQLRIYSEGPDGKTLGIILLKKDLS